MPAKKSTSKKTTKKTAAKKSAVKKTAKKTATKAASGKKVADKKSASKAAASPQKRDATEAIRQVQKNHKSQKHQVVRANYVLFTIEDAREILKKRSSEEKASRPTKKKVAQVAQKKVETSPVDVIPQVKSRHAAASLDDILGLATATTAVQQKTVPKKFQKYFDLLVELRDEVRAELNLHTSDTLKRSSKDDAGDIAISVDAGTDNFDRDFALSLLSSEQDALNEIEAAIQRIYNGSYGICEETGEPISAERLEAVPFTRFSVEGQKSYEANARKRVSRAGAFLNEDNGEKISFGDEDGDN